MFYRTDGPHGLPHDPFKACVVPRPIGWISTLDAVGVVNLAPYSYFNAICGDPPMVMFASGSRASNGDMKDSLSNVEATGEFVCNMATWSLRKQMHETSAPVDPEADEFDLAGLETAPAELVKPPRVKAAPIHLECLHHRTVELPATAAGERNAMCLGRVIGVHIADSVLKDGLVDVAAVRPVARLGYHDYTSVEDIFAMRFFE